MLKIVNDSKWREYNNDISLYYLKEGACDEKDYLKIVSNYITYYHLRAKKCKYLFYILNTLKIIVLLILPILQSIEYIASIPAISVAASSSCIFIETILQFWKTKDKWVQYRNVNSMLMSEQRKYMTKTEGYCKEEEAFDIFVENIEKLIDDEARKWCEIVTKKDEKGNENG